MVKTIRLWMTAIFAVSALTGCGSTMTMRDVGIGMQVGSLGGNAGILSPIVWGTGVILEKVGDAINSGSQVSAGQSEPEIIQRGENPLAASQPVEREMGDTL